VKKKYVLGVDSFDKATNTKRHRRRDDDEAVATSRRDTNRPTITSRPRLAV